jgi:hypothetical protein
MCQVKWSGSTTLMSLVLQPFINFKTTLFDKKIPPQVGSYRIEAVAK